MVYICADFLRASLCPTNTTTFNRQVLGPSNPSFRTAVTHHRDREVMASQFVRDMSVADPEDANAISAAKGAA
jgi:hypothetical protein